MPVSSSSHRRRRALPLLLSATFLKVILTVVTPATPIIEQVHSWGWTAVRNARRLHELRAAGPPGTAFALVERFKLALAVDNGAAAGEGEDEEMAAAREVLRALPPGLSAVRVASDFLRCLTTFVGDVLKRGVPFYHRDLVQWCLTVPAM